MKLQTIALGLLLALAAGFAGGFGVRSYIAGKHDLQVQVTDLTADKAELKQFAEQAATDAATIGLLQETLHNHDVETTKALNEKQAANTALARDLAVAQRMRFNGAQCPKASTDPATATAGGVGDGTGVELSAEGRQDVFDLRANITTNEAKVTYFQGYVPEILKYVEELRRSCQYTLQ